VALRKSAGLLACFVDVLVIHFVVVFVSLIAALLTDFWFRCPAPSRVV